MGNIEWAAEEHVLLEVIRSQDREIIELRKELDQYRRSGFCLPGWFCPKCRVFNGEAKSILSECRACEAPKPDWRPLRGG